MKKLTLIVTVLSLALSANAQLKVKSNGQVSIGNQSLTSTNYPIKPVSGNITTPGIAVGLAIDTVSALVIGKDVNSSDSRTIAFGSGSDVYIREIISPSSISSYNKNNTLLLGGKGGLRYECGKSTVFQYDPTMKTYGAGVAFNFQVPVVAPQFLTQSDANLKENIEPLEDVGMSLAEITPVSYTLKSNADNDETSGNKAAARSAENRHLQYGFIAQEVKEIYPDLVYEDSDGLLSIDYTGFIPILVDAVKDLKAQVKAQELVIDSLRNQQQQTVPFSDSGAVVASLSQNRPNPFRVSTTIGCTVPETVASAFICVYDLNGSQKLRKDIQQRGNAEVTIDGNTFPAGMYIYTLICDGQEIDSKRMILTD